MQNWEEDLKKRQEEEKLRKEYGAFFEELDQEEDEVIYVKEVVDFLRSTNKQIETPMKKKEFRWHLLSDKEYRMQQRLNELLKDENRLVDFFAFCKCEIDEMDIKSVFKMVDVDKSGNISRTELKMACKFLGKRYGIKDAKVWSDLMKESDQDGDGKLDYKEFKTIIKKVEELVNNKESNGQSI